MLDALVLWNLVSRVVLAGFDPAQRVTRPHSTELYAAAVALPAARTRLYVEAARPDGAHDPVTVVG